MLHSVAICATLCNKLLHTVSLLHTVPHQWFSLWQQLFPIKARSYKNSINGLHNYLYTKYSGYNYFDKCYRFCMVVHLGFKLPFNVFLFYWFLIYFSILLIHLTMFRRILDIAICWILWDGKVCKCRTLWSRNKYSKKVEHTTEHTTKQL